MILTRDPEKTSYAADPNGEYGGETALCVAAQKGHSAVAVALVEHNADMNLAESIGASNTPLCWAARNGHAETVAMLLQTGADPSEPRGDGKTARDLALENGHPHIASILVPPTSRLLPQSVLTTPPEGTPLPRSEAARDAIRFKHLSQSCLNELQPGRPVSPPIPDYKRAQGHKRVRFYNNTPDDVELFFKEQGVTKTMFDIRSGNKSESFAMEGSKFHAATPDRSKKYGPWTVDDSFETQVYFLIDPEVKGSALVEDGDRTADAVTSDEALTIPPEHTDTSGVVVHISDGDGGDGTDSEEANISWYEDMLPRTRSAEERELQQALELSAAMVDRLVRQVSGGKDTTLCKICYGNVPVADCVVSCRRNHLWCRECLAGYLASKITENSLRVLCPDIDEEANPGGCDQIMSEELILEVCDEDTKEKFDRWKRIAGDPNLRECPNVIDGEMCGHSQAGRPRNPSMTCDKCGYEYCFFHASAHVGLTCRQYEKAQRKAESESLWLIEHCSKRCPKCKVPTQKNDGCNHMTCRECNQDWCWICGRKTGRHGGSHYAPLNPFGCPGMQMQADFIDNDSYRRTFLNYMLLADVKLCSIILMLPALPVAIVSSIVAIVFAIPCILLSWCACGCPDDRYGRRGRACNPGRICRKFRDLVEDGESFAIALCAAGLWPVGLTCLLWSVSIHLLISPIHICCSRALTYHGQEVIHYVASCASIYAF